VASAAHFHDRFLRCGYGRRQRLAVVSVSGSGRRMGGLAAAPVGVRNRTEERTLLECGGKPSSRTRPAAPAGVPSRTSRGLAAGGQLGISPTEEIPQLAGSGGR
jgi:hypothetical protein